MKLSNNSFLCGFCNLVTFQNVKKCRSEGKKKGSGSDQVRCSSCHNFISQKGGKF